VTKRFYRSDKSRRTEGLGLGLSLVAAIVKLHESSRRCQWCVKPERPLAGLRGRSQGTPRTSPALLSQRAPRPAVLSIWGGLELLKFAERRCSAANEAFNRQCPFGVCAVERRRFPVGASPTRQTLQPEATGAAMEVTSVGARPRSDQYLPTAKRATACSSQSRPNPGPFAFMVPLTAMFGSARMAPATSRYSSQ